MTAGGPDEGRTPGDGAGNDGRDPMDEVRADLEAAERKIAGEIDPGARALVVAVGVLVLLGSFSLPHAGAANGWEVLSFAPDATAESIALPSRIFVWLALVFGSIFAIRARATRRWVLAWLALAGSAVSIVFGMLSIWTRQTLPVGDPGAGPGIGLILGWFAVMVLTFHWAKVVWTRTALQLAAEAELRDAAARDENKGLLDD